MSKLRLIIGNKNYSSWSLRPWIAMEMAGIPFDETLIPLDTPDTERLIAEHSAAGRVPVLRHGALTIWESLAILEYLAETFRDKGLWPEDKEARAFARSVSNEMHAGFSALRNTCPMNLRRPRRKVPMSDATQRDIARIEDIWRTCRGRFGHGGDFLFGSFGIADAMYAPVVTRFDTFDIDVAADARRYMQAVLATPAFVKWKAAALQESWIVQADEVD
jgi:glutathione S-transferase